MEAPNSIELAAVARSEGLEPILVGGNAVNLYAYLRTTFDVDLLVLETHRKMWTDFFEKRGYEIFHATDNFIRMRFAADATGALPVDLMLADAATFEKIREKSQARDVGHGVQIAIPHPLHLIAMKLHALRSAHRVERGTDLGDIRHLIASEKIDPASSEFRDILTRYASEPIQAKLLRDCA